MLDGLTQRLARVAKTIRGEARLTEGNIQEALREVHVALLEVSAGCLRLPDRRPILIAALCWLLGAPGQALAQPAAENAACENATSTAAMRSCAPPSGRGSSSARPKRNTRPTPQGTEHWRR